MTGTDGAIATFQVAVAADATPGDVVVEVKNAVMIEANTSSTHNYPSKSFTWTIEEGAVAVEGDANGDGEVDIADYTYILNVMADDGEASEYPEVDVNGDNEIDIADATYVLNLMADADESSIGEYGTSRLKMADQRRRHAAYASIHRHDQHLHRHLLHDTRLTAVFFLQHDVPVLQRWVHFHQGLRRLFEAPAPHF